MTYPAVSTAASVAAWSHALEIVVPRSQPKLRSSGGNAASKSSVSGKRLGDRYRIGIGPATPCGGFHSSATDAVFSLASFDLKNSSRSG